MLHPKAKRRGFLWFGRGDGSSRKPRRPRQAALAIEGLEDRVVLSALFGGGGTGGSSGSSSSPILLGSGTGSGGLGGGCGGLGGSQQGLGGGFGHGQGGFGGGTSSVRSQDAQKVQRALQTFDASYLAAQAALRLTASSTTAPTSAGISAFNASITTAINTLDSTIATDLANLTNTGATVIGTVDGYTAALQTEVDSAATGLANSTNASVVSLNQEVNTYLRSAGQQISSAILSDTATGTIGSSTVQTYKQAAQAAFQAFNSAIASAEQTSLAGGTALSGTAIDAAVLTLQSALTTAITGLGFTSSTYDPTTTVTTDLTNLGTALKAITAPTSTSAASERLFLQTVNMTLMQYESQIEQAAGTAIQKYNNSLL